MPITRKRSQYSSRVDKKTKSIITVRHKTKPFYSILFLPSSALEYLAALRPRSCLATSGPSSGSFLTLLIVSW